MRALIFGANGFVGGHLVRELVSHGYETYGVDRQSEAHYAEYAGYRPGDITDLTGVVSVCQEFQPDVIVDLAAIASVGVSWRSPQLTMELNVCGALNVFEAARSLEPQPKVLVIGSSEEYSASRAPLCETDPIDATNPYGISKMAQERFAEAYASRYGLRIYRTRSFNHIGPNQSPDFVIAGWCKQVAEIDASSMPGTMSVGNLEVARDFTDVRDVVRAYRLLVESDHSNEVFNIGSGIARPLRDVLNTIKGFSSQTIEVKTNPELLRPSDNPVICCDAAKAHKQLAWQPEIPFEKTLHDTYESFRAELQT